jgi:PLD-like domain
MARMIRQNTWHSRTEVAELLQAIFSAELLKPSEDFWLTSPWISDIPILDNRALGFDFGNGWGPEKITLSRVLVAMASKGCKVCVITTSDINNNSFLGRLESEKLERGIGDQVKVLFDDEENLHEKAVVGDDYVIDGSMNLTFHGLLIRRERVNFETSPGIVAAVKLEMINDFGDRRG